MNGFSILMDGTGWLVALLLTLTYGLLTGFRLQKGAGLYAVSLLLLAGGPLVTRQLLGDTYPFSAHMIGHILLLLVCAPLLVLGFPRHLTGGAARAVERFTRFLQQWPGLGWLAGVGTMWVWHLPGLFQALVTHRSEAFGVLPLLHTASLLAAGILFSWPILGPEEPRRIHPLSGVLYLFTACTACSLLGLAITFAPAGFYPYPQTIPYAGVTQVLCGSLNSNGTDDQQTAGLIMWVPCCLIYLTGAMYLFSNWLIDKAPTNSVLDNRLPVSEI